MGYCLLYLRAHAYSVIGETLSYHTMFDEIDAEAGDWFIANTPIDARVATTSEGTHMRPVRCSFIWALFL